MSSEPRFCLEPVDDWPVDVLELKAAIYQLPPASQELLQPFMQDVLAASQRRRRILRLIQDALGQLRLDMQYLKFDLEATRRERDQMRSAGDQCDS